MSASQKKRVIVGMSGGVDSSVAALLLQQQGYDVHGLYMFNWEEDEQGYCTAAEDFQDARRVCEHLGLPLHQVSFAAEYRKSVFEVFLAGLESGCTPNPDVLCNREIKFGRFLDHARRLGANLVATGHYARRVSEGSTHQLFRGVDAGKDQSYFLHSVSEAALGQALFPLGELRKSEVREIALAAGLHNSRKRDSTGICFIGERPFREFLGAYLPVKPGEIQTTDNVPVGEHCGLAFYTLGQRQGLGIGGVRGSSEQPWYVAAKDHERNVLVVVQGHDDPLLYSPSLRTGVMHWINGA
ncbi:MAG: tRNA 2-thiouridine(34) synthase MnmA, partial [Gammaproteobacteria bacterium]|nr:tRNA 2-thiouridine(34) synthase MnmA [Gammaproteobacteria bacterium]